jgi:DNA-3-methyladenine glycosylase II
MPRHEDASDGPGVLISPVQPYDFSLSMRAIRSFRPAPADPEKALRLAARVEGTPALIEVSEAPGAAGRLRVTSRPETPGGPLGAIAAWVLFAELDLVPFNRLIGGHPRLGALAKRLFGLKPMRPVSLFEMFVTAITEQQISLAAAYAIRSRLVERFGEPVDGLRVFPEPRMLAGASLEDLRAGGLSRQKAEYIRSTAAAITAGGFDIEALKTMEDDAAREAIMGLKGFGAWSADYILVRGLARPDCVPVADIGIQKVVGEYLSDGRRLRPDEVTEILEPFRPYRGLLAFYLLAAHRLGIT